MGINNIRDFLDRFGLHLRGFNLVASCRARCWWIFYCILLKEISFFQDTIPVARCLPFVFFFPEATSWVVGSLKYPCNERVQFREQPPGLLSNQCKVETVEVPETQALLAFWFGKCFPMHPMDSFFPYPVPLEVSCLQGDLLTDNFLDKEHKHHIGGEWLNYIFD